MTRVLIYGGGVVLALLILAAVFAAVDYYLVQRALRQQVKHWKAVAADNARKAALAEGALTLERRVTQDATAYIAGIPDRTLTPLELATIRQELVQVLGGLRTSV